MSDEYKIDPVHHEVIEDRILTGITEENKVALLLTEEELRLIIRAVDSAFLVIKDPRSDTANGLRDLQHGMRKLAMEAFG